MATKRWYLVPVKMSAWVAPIVPVAKKEGHVMICGDFKVIVNSVTTLERYPIPRIEDLYIGHALWG